MSHATCDSLAISPKSGDIEGYCCYCPDDPEDKVLINGSFINLLHSVAVQCSSHDLVLSANPLIAPNN